ncbi:MAG: (d)CMP kinase [Lewinella sp.]|nr:(d)CMP kinase [Lewinella sp.]
MENRQKIIIAVDGRSSCGKSTLAKGLAQQLEYLYIDSGAMYRAVTLYFLRQGIDWGVDDQVKAALGQIQITFSRDSGVLRTFLNGEDVEEAIRGMEVSGSVSPVSAISAVRKALVAQQQQLGAQRGIVMDGRDIGTVVFPDATLKIFLTASQEERTRRRYLELLAKGKTISREDVARNLAERDHIDSTRADSPLRQAIDAVVIDNTNLTVEEQLAMLLALARQRGA